MAYPLCHAGIVAEMFRGKEKRSISKRHLAGLRNLVILPVFYGQ